LISAKASIFFLETLSISPVKANFTNKIDIFSTELIMSFAPETKLWVNKVFDVSLIIWKYLFVQLPAIERKYEQFQCTLQSVRATRKTTQSACETSQVMTQFCVITFNRVSIVFALRYFIPTVVIPKTSISIEAIAEIPFCLLSIIYHELDDGLSTLPDHHPTQNAARFSINDGDYVYPVFLSPINVNNSSISAISAFSTFSRIGATSSFSICALV
jgi:hypothetical protein